MVDGFFEDRTFKAYYQDVGKHPILTHKQEREYLQRYRHCPLCSKAIPYKVRLTNCPTCGLPAPKRTKGRTHTCTTCATKFDVLITPQYCPHCGSDRDAHAREVLIVSNLRFVMKMAKSFTKNPVHIQRLVSAGNVGLIIAIDKYKLSKNTRFLTYAAWWIRKEMLDELHSSGLIHVPSHKQKAHRKAVKEGIYVCSYCGLRVDHPDHLLDELPSCSADAHDFQLTEDPDGLGTVVSVDKCQLVDDSDAEEDTIQNGTGKFIRNILRTMPLSVRDRFIILRYYNIPAGDRKSEGKSLHLLAALTGITPERVRQVKERVLQDLRVELKRKSVVEASDVCC